MIQPSRFLRSLLAAAIVVGFAGVSTAARADLLDDVRAAKKIRVAIDLGSPPTA